MNAHDFLVALTTVLGVAAVTTVLFERLKQPVVLGYILAGFIVGPSFPIPLVADREIVHALSEAGVILLMFSLGLEFSLSKLLSVGVTAGLTAVLQSSLMFWLGYLMGGWFGWTTVESLFTGAIIAISSTTIIAKVFDERGIRGSLRELVVGVLIVEDLIAILLIAALTAIASRSGLSPVAMALTTGKLALFLVSLVAFGLLVVPRSTRALVRTGRKETTLVTSIGFCFAVALLAHAFGYSVALGAFIAGSLVAESGKAHDIEHLVTPVRDVFAAIFFVSVGILIDPRLIAEHWVAVLTLTVLVIVGKFVGVLVGAFLIGNGVRTSVQAGMSLAQIGEFSFIIAGVGLSLGATGRFLYPVAVAVSAITTLTTPWLIAASGPVANFIDRKMPARLQMFVSLYGSWLSELRRRPSDAGRVSRIRHLVRLLLLDTALLAGIAIGTTLGFSHSTRWLARELALARDVASIVVIGGACLVALPFLAGVIRVVRGLGTAIALAVLPAADEGKLDLAATPRRALVVTLQLTIVLVLGLPLLAITQPILGGAVGPLVFAGLLLVLGLGFWRGASELHSHVRAGAQTIVEVLAQSARAGHTAEPGNDHLELGRPSLVAVHQLLPGIGEPTAYELGASSPAVGRTLAELNLRGITGATVLAITRGDAGVLVPSAEEMLRPGDVLALAGSPASVAAAERLLGGADPTEPPPAET